MGRIAVAAGCVVAILIGGFLSLNYVISLCDEMLDTIDQSLEQVARTGSDDADALTQAYDVWARHHTYLCAFIDHEQIDQVTNSFQRAMAFASYETYDEYLAELLQLKALLEMLKNFDRPSLRSIL